MVSMAASVPMPTTGSGAAVEAELGVLASFLLRTGRYGGRREPKTCFVQNI